MKVQVNFKDNDKENTYDVEAEWEESIVDFKNRLFREYNKDIIPKLTKIKLENGPTIKDEQTIGDACLSYFYLNSKDQTPDNFSKVQKPVLRAETTIRIKRDASKRELGRPNTPMINPKSLQILKDANLLGEYGTPKQLQDRLYRMHENKNRDIEKKRNITEAALKENKIKISKNSEIIIAKKGPRENIFKALYNDLEKNKEKLKTLENKYKRSSGSPAPKPKPIKRKIPEKLLHKTQSSVDVFDKLYKDYTEYNNRKLERSKQSEKDLKVMQTQVSFSKNSQYKDSEKIKKRLEYSTSYTDFLYHEGYGSYNKVVEHRNEERKQLWTKYYLSTCTFKPKLNLKGATEKREEVLARLVAPKEEPKPIKNPHLTFKPNLVHSKKY